MLKKVLQELDLFIKSGEGNVILFYQNPTKVRRNTILHPIGKTGKYFEIPQRISCKVLLFALVTISDMMITVPHNNHTYHHACLFYSL